MAVGQGGQEVDGTRVTAAGHTVNGLCLFRERPGGEDGGMIFKTLRPGWVSVEAENREGYKQEQDTGKAGCIREMD